MGKTINVKPATHSLIYNLGKMGQSANDVVYEILNAEKKRREKRGA